MTEQANIAVMNREEFEEHHARTGQWIARVGKIWEAVAEEQQAIVDGKGYVHLGYTSWAKYWTEEWAEASGWSYHAVKVWMTGRRRKLEDTQRDHDLPDLGPHEWMHVHRELTDPNERREFLAQYEDLKPSGVAIAKQRIGEAVEKFRGEREPTVADIGEDMARQVARGEAPKIPMYREVNRSVRRLSSQIAGLDPQETAQQLKQEQTETTLDWAVRDASELMEWLERYVAAIEHVNVVELKKVNDAH